MKFQGLTIISILIFCVLSCNSNADKANVNDIIIAIEIKGNISNYVGSTEPPLKIGDRFFEIRYKAHYEKGDIYSLTKYMSEGTVEYSQSDLKADSLILKDIEIPNNQKYRLTEESLLKKNNSEKRLIKLDKTHFMEERDKNVVIYVI
ncbi:hypothetical protein [Emticicia sp. TH156]|uniref:hypothetical protein n=1 Tax=Emticicia sp. TH156 TaxID=2067454 RepID=UPI000CBB81EA|nr:hypothetical protein [Emticicia sp. TH156]PLK42060.1 hypothetical protein C0V77_22885 [Emticicia sp. TH156]